VTFASFKARPVRLSHVAGNAGVARKDAIAKMAQVMVDLVIGISRTKKRRNSEF
jgi:hypothetical protein